MPLADQEMRAAIAVTRFGLGAKPGELDEARKDPKVDVHYTQRKFLSKPKGSAPGLVRLSRFKNITVEPKEGIERI